MKSVSENQCKWLLIYANDDLSNVNIELISEKINLFDILRIELICQQNLSLQI